MCSHNTKRRRQRVPLKYVERSKRDDAVACGRTGARATVSVRDTQVYSATVSEGLTQPQHSSLIKPPTFIHFHFQYQRRPTRFVAPLHHTEPKDLQEVESGYESEFT